MVSTQLQALLWTTALLVAAIQLPNTNAFVSKLIDYRNHHNSAPTVVHALKPHERKLEAITSGLVDLEKFASAPLVSTFSDLQSPLYKKGSAAQVPWPSGYWPTYLDGINVQWAENEASPSAKYAKAYGIKGNDFAAEMSFASGMLSDTRRRTCTADSMCLDGSVCVMGYGLALGYCIYTWEGLCHAWASAAVIEKEPECPVEFNGVVFQPLDIKALLTQVYHITPPGQFAIGSLYNGDDKIVKDDSGRPTDSGFRDVNPGIFHIALANVMGKLNKSFVFDRVASSEIWNHPVRSYEVLEMSKLKLVNGSKQFFNTSTYPHNDLATQLAYVKVAVMWVNEIAENGPLVSTGRVDLYTNTTTYEYLLELDSQDNIIGGEWVGNSVSDHPDLMVFFTSPPTKATTSNLSYVNISKLLRASQACNHTQPATIVNVTAFEATLSASNENNRTALTEATDASAENSPAPSTASPVPTTAPPTTAPATVSSESSSARDPTGLVFVMVGIVVVAVVIVAVYVLKRRRAQEEPETSFYHKADVPDTGTFV